MRTPRPSRHIGCRVPRIGGFTLIEIIVVLLVFSVMAAMAYGGLNSVLRTRRGIEDSMQRTAELQRAYQRLRNDFQNLRDRPARDAYGDAQSALTMDREGVLSAIRGGWRSPLQANRPSLERIGYRFADDTLYRITYRAVDLPQEPKPQELPLLRKVREIRWRFLDTDNEWQTQWPPSNRSNGSLTASTAAQPPPLAVEITLDTPDWGELRFLFRTATASLVGGRSALGSTAAGETGSSLLTREGLLPASALGAAPSLGGDAPPDEGQTPTTPNPSTPEDPGIPSSGEGSVSETGE